MFCKVPPGMRDFPNTTTVVILWPSTWREKLWCEPLPFFPAEKPRRFNAATTCLLEQAGSLLPTYRQAKFQQSHRLPWCHLFLAAAPARMTRLQFDGALLENALALAILFDGV